MGRVLLIVFTLAVTVFAVAEIAMTKPEKFPSGQFPGGIPKAFWILVSLLVAPLGGLAWIVISRVQLADERGVSPREVLQRRPFSTGSATADSATTGQVAPDDDPEFLWQLEKELYQRRKAQQAEQPGLAEPDNPDGPDNLNERDNPENRALTNQFEEVEDADDDSSDASR